MFNNCDCPMDGCSRLMRPLVVEATRFLISGANSGWFGLACPAHCSSSFVLRAAVFASWFGLGALTVILWTFHHLWIFPSSGPVARPPSPASPSDRLLAYLHERRGLTPDRSNPSGSQRSATHRWPSWVSSSAQHGSARAPVSVLLSLLRGTWYLKVSRSQRHLRTRTFSKWLSCLLRCLPIALKLCNRLGQNKEERAQRAWEAGTWARAVLEGRISKPRPTEKLAIQPAGYIVWCACGTRKVWCVLSVWGGM